MNIFWSWQSDTPEPENRHFIQKALEEASKLAANDLGLHPADRPEIDHDTKGEAGLVEIAATIFKKVEEAALFVADITPISKTDSGKEVANPNVLIELGYALKVHGHKSLITVSNLTYGGEPEKLPFDLRHRRGAITYTLPADAPKAEREKQFKRLTKSLAGAIASNLPAALTAGANKEAFVRTPARADDPSTWLPLGGTVCHSDDSNAKVEHIWKVRDGTRAYARVIPAGWKPRPPSRNELSSPTSGGTLPTVGLTMGGWRGPNTEGVVQIWVDPTTSDVASTVSQFFLPTGELWSFNTLITDVSDGETILSTHRIIKDWETFLRGSFKMFAAHHATPPFYVEVGVAGLLGVRIPGQFKSQRSPAFEPVVTHSEIVGAWTADAELEFLTEAFNRLLDAFSKPRASEADIRKLLDRISP